MPTIARFPSTYTLDVPIIQQWIQTNGTFKVTADEVTDDQAEERFEDNEIARCFNDAMEGWEIKSFKRKAGSLTEMST